MEISDITRRIVSVEINKNDLLSIFQQKSGMKDIDVFKIILITGRGREQMYTDASSISLIGVSESLKSAGLKVKGDNNGKKKLPAP